MSNNQNHGKEFENYIKLAFKNSINHNGSYLNLWDIESKYDYDKLPTSIKSTGSNIIYLSDARRFWLIKEPYRLLVGQYNQTLDMKIFHTLYEFLISPEEHLKILGEISYKEIEDFHNKLISYKEGFHKEARIFAKNNKKNLINNSIIKLNPKIDSKNQRRLQCSVDIKNLLLNIKNSFIYKTNYRNIMVDFSIISSKRSL